MNNREIAFMKIFVSLLEQNYDIYHILELCSSLHYTKECQSLSNSLKNGDDLAQALLQYDFSATFKEYFYFFKNSFSVSEALTKTIQICEKKNSIKKKLAQKLTYPLCLLVFLFLFSIFIITFLLPQVEILFADFQIEKSWLITGIFIMLHLIPILIFLSFFIVAFTLVYVYLCIKKINFKAIDMLIERIPFLGKLIQKYYSLKFAIYYDELLKNNYDATTIIEILYEHIHDSDIKMIIYELHHYIIEGKSLEKAIEQFSYFEADFKTFYLMMNESHEEKSLQDYIHIVYMQIDHVIAMIIRIAVPFIYGFVAIFVVSVYLSMIIPMMNSVSNL